MKNETNKKLGLLPATSLVLGNMVGSGVFLLPASLAVYGGISILGWVLSSIGAILLAYIFSNLSKHFPKAGGPYAYTRMGFGDFPAFLVAWGYWISIIATNAAITVALLSYLTVFFPSLSTNPFLSIGLGLSIIWFLTWINNRGVHTAGWVQLVTTILKIIPLLLVAFVGIFYINSAHFEPFNISTESNWSAIIATATLTLFAYLGIECATIPADNIKNPTVTIPRATTIGTWSAILIYVLGSIAILGIIPPETLQQSAAPYADAAATIWGEPARYLVAIGAIISTFGALNGWILMQGQVPLAAANDDLFPTFFKQLNQHKSPAKGILFSSVLVSLLMVLNYSEGFIEAFEFMILLATLTVLVPYLFSTATYLLFHLQPPQIDQNKWSWSIGLLGFIFSLLAVVGSGEEVVFWGFLLLMGGIPFYVWLKRGELIGD